MQYKSFNLPVDLYILLIVPFKIISARRKVNKIGFSTLLNQWETGSGTNKPDQAFMRKLYKFHKAASFYLVKVFKDPNPCMIRSMLLYQMCLKHNIQARLVTGVAKEDSRLKGHSWLEIDGLPFNEDRDYLSKFSVMIEV